VAADHFVNQPPALVGGLENFGPGLRLRVWTGRDYTAAAFFRVTGDKEEILPVKVNFRAGSLRAGQVIIRPVEESFQLKVLMEEAKTSFDALHRLETPGSGRVSATGI
jgi:hypothetical protein